MSEGTIQKTAELLEVGCYVSTQVLISKIDCTESELKSILESMRGQGYEIEENPELGIRLLSDPDVLSGRAVKTGLQARILGRSILYDSSLDSTNEKAKTLGRQGDEEGTVVIADEQTEGRGRFGRNWFSPRGEGIWMSVILRPPSVLEPYTPLSLVTAHCVATALRDVAGVRAEIKWPNDVKIGDKKVCGILTELDKDTAGTSFLVIGIGVNVNQTVFEGELASLATSVRIETGKAANRTPLIRKILENLERSYLKAVEEGFSEVLKDVRKLCTLVGEHVSVNVGSETVQGYVQDIDDAGRLIMRTEDGKIREILAGEANTVR